MDLSFDPGSGAGGGGIDAVAVQTDGKVLVSGDFSSINGVSRRGIARLNTDGSVDLGFNPGTGADGRVPALAVQSDGKVLIGGWFTSVNGVSRNRVARLNADGSVDSTFDTGPGPAWSNDYFAWRLAVQPDGKVLIGGGLLAFNGATLNRIARLNSDGSLDPSFNVGSGANQDVYSVAVQSDGKVLIGGTFTSVNDLSRSRLARLNGDGSVDIGFSPGVAGPVFSVVVQPDGNILIGGNMGSVNGVTRIGVARIQANGTVDLSFDPGAGPDNQVRSVALQADGKVVLGGDFTSVNAVTRVRIARLEGGPLVPTVTLNGPAAMTLDYNTPFTDPGASALDSCGGSLPVTAAGAVDVLAAGTHTLTYSATDAAGQTGSVSRLVTVNRGSQSITFNSILDHTHGDAPFTISATASSGLPVSFTSLTPSVVTVSGNIVTIVGAGSGTIRASQGGDANYRAAANVEQVLTVAKANQSITFNPPATSTYGADLTLNGTASSGLAVSYAVSGPATFNGSILHFTGLGTVTVTAAQAGNANFNPASSVTRSITVGKAVLTVIADNKTRVYGQANPALTFTYSGFVNGDTAAVLKGSPKLSTAAATSSPVGTYPITVSQGNLSAANYSFALASGSMSVTAANTTVSAANVTAKFGAASVTLSASVAAVSPSTASVNEGTVTFTVRNSSGVTISQSVTGTVSRGTATASFPASALVRGTYTISVLYTDTLATPNFNNSIGVATGTLTIR